jgi:hypothetical protein
MNMGKVKDVVVHPMMEDASPTALGHGLTATMMAKRSPAF